MNVSSFLFLPEPTPQPDVTGGATAKGLFTGPEGGSAGSFLSFMESMGAGTAAEIAPDIRVEEVLREAVRGLPRDAVEPEADAVEIDGASTAPVPPGVVAVPEYVGASESEGKVAAQETCEEGNIGSKEEWIRLFGDPPSGEGTNAAGPDLATPRRGGEPGPAPVMFPGSAAVSKEAVAVGREALAAADAPAEETSGSDRGTVQSERPAEGAREGRVENPETVGHAGRLRSAVSFSERGPEIAAEPEKVKGDRMGTESRTRVERTADGERALDEGKAVHRVADGGGIKESEHGRAAGRTTEEPKGSAATSTRGDDVRGIESKESAPARGGDRGVSPRLEDTPVTRTVEGARARSAEAEGETLRDADGTGLQREGRAERRSSLRMETPESPAASGKTETATPVRGGAESVATTGSTREEARRAGGAEPAAPVEKKMEVPDHRVEARGSKMAEVKSSFTDARPVTDEAGERITREAGSETVRTDGRASIAETAEQIGRDAETIPVRSAGEGRAETVVVGERIERRAETVPSGEAGNAETVETEERVDRRVETIPARSAAEGRSETIVVEERVVTRTERVAVREESEKVMNAQATPEPREGTPSEAIETAETETREGTKDGLSGDSHRREETGRNGAEAAAAYAAGRKSEHINSHRSEASPAIEAVGVKETAASPSTGTSLSVVSEPSAQDRAERALLESRAVREEILDRLIEQTQRIVKSGRNEAEIQLDPPELGKVRVKLMVTEGSVRGFIEVENPNVQAALQTDLSRLTSALADSGLDLTQFDVLLHDNRRSGGRQAGKSLRDRASSEAGEGEATETARPERPRGVNGSRLVDTWM
ncbi:MAG: flagellar hook-length control protein FliK [Candidatus Eisenbacteria bacterium]|nr:flagellar hook-length control protein FliK [Candidatus Eisenbacteria bacterium]